jgi:hypothetical protein
MQIIPAVQPLDYWNLGAGIGSALHIARLYIAAGLLPSGYKILIVPAAKGSTSVLNWDGTQLDDNGDDLWGDMVTRLQFALSLPNSHLKLFVWRQIEADQTAAASIHNTLHGLMPDAATWKTHTLALMDRFRSIFPFCPIIYAQPTREYSVSNSMGPSFLLTLAEIAAARPQCAVIDTAGLTTNAPYVDQGFIHFSAASQIEIARRTIPALHALSTTLTVSML